MSITLVLKTFHTPDPSYAKPVIRWAGSKRKLLPELLRLAPQTFGQYFEPFVGSGCLFFALSPDSATLGDINAELISAYRCLRRSPTSVFDLALSYPRTKHFYYKIRSAETPSDPLERTARFIYLNRHCFNGLYRTNQQGEFNVPRGTKTGQLPGVETFKRAARTLHGKKLICGDFEVTLKGVQRDDFVYLDPPYASIDRKSRNEYGIGSFKPTDIPRLMRTIRAIHDRGARFLLSYSTAPDFIDQLPRRIARKTISVQRSIASNPVFRSSAPEVLLRNSDLFGND